MNNANPGSAYAKMVSASCLFVLACILVAGLWPFHVPRNAVKWLKNENGLSFSGHGSAVSASAFRTTGSPNDTGHSLEIWLVPARTGGGSILAFDSSPDPRAPFLLRQYGTSIAVQRCFVDEQGNVTQLWFRVDHVFQAGKRVFVAITSNKNETELYVNGVLAGTSSDSGIVSQELTGRLVLANSTLDDSWTGQISGLAIYDRELTSAQVSNHFQSWTPDQGPSLTTGEQSPVALYLFDERVGSTVHNLVDPATNLTIPAKYFVLHAAFLRSTWDQYSHTRSVWKHWSFWEDLGVNIGGFVPVGFVFFAYFSSVKRTGRPALAAILLGLFLSFAIETLQRLLPNRDSGMTDLFTNTTGTAIGVLLYRCLAVRTFWTKVLDFGEPASEARSQRPVVENHTPTQDEKLTFSA